MKTVLTTHQSAAVAERCLRSDIEACTTQGDYSDRRLVETDRESPLQQAHNAISSGWGTVAWFLRGGD